MNPWLDDPRKTTLFGVPMLQKFSDLVLFEKLLENEKFRAIFELGAYMGGLSLYLLMQCTQRNMIFWCWDMRAPSVLGTALGNKHRFRDYYWQEDVFALDGHVRMLMDTDAVHPMLLLCDGGNKPAEMRTFAPLLWSGDVIGVHDWGQEYHPHEVQPLIDNGTLGTFWWQECVALDSMWRFWRRL